MLTAGLVILFGAPSIAWSSTFQVSEVYDFLTKDPVAGGGTLTREGDSVSLRVSAAGLDASSTYSAWYIIFNKPGKCGGGSGICTGGDLGNPEVQGAVRNAGGFVTGADGTGYFAGELKVGDMPKGMAGFGALKNSSKAEIHILLQTHSAHNVGSVSLQMSVPGAACNPGCDDQFFLVFPPAE